jgi:glycerol-3-phosphate dehydrogenase
LHGGLRYLAQGRVGLVHEASVEKKVIHHIAPHLAEPLPFIFPTYRGNKHWVLWQLKIGVKVYDLLCGGRNLGRSTWLSQREVRASRPRSRPVNLNGAVRYYDGLTNDARLTLDTLRSAARQRCAHRELLPVSSDAQRVEKRRLIGEPLVLFCGGCSAKRAPGTRCRARTVVNATGPWADGLPHSRVKLRVTKGIHLVVERSRVPVPETVVMTEGKRILFAIPWGERTIMGTTDTDYDGPLDRVTAEAADIRYVLDITNQFFPSSKTEVARM